MKGRILVLAEYKDGEIDNITWELLTKGRALADRWDTSLAVLIVGTELEAMADHLKRRGVDQVLLANDPGLNDYNAELYTTVIADCVNTYNPSLILIGYTYLGMEVGPALAVRIGGTMVSNCTEMDLAEDRITVMRSMFGGTLQAKVALTGPVPYIVSFEKGVLPKETLASRNASVEAMAVNTSEQSLRSKIIDILKADKGDIDITTAKILVSAGRGIGSPKNIQILRDLADALGGELACSRPVADMGWLPCAHQVGISASNVTPDIYIACGISGASQHVTAMRDSGTIIAINKDPNAPIFRVANYGIVGDVLEVVPAMIAEITG